ncbi:MAG: hydrogenase maturation nickel metallochaperone HypA [Pirellulales bacterium]
MHELSIAMSIVDLAAEELERQGGSVVVAVHLQIGAWSGVVKEALQSAFELAREGSPLEHCELKIEEIEATMHCPTCECERPVASFHDVRCAVCGSYATEFVRGRELEVVAMEFES